ncbi:MAG: D-alanyl-D-alanine carboxypeptidase [Clostridia bacterium]|nr:D-alanyl-D-alanine carboxypeptidase [Clostridia bacterium]
MMKTKQSRTVRWLCVTLVLLTLFAFPLSVSYAEPSSKDQANHILLYCLSTDTLLYEKNTDMPLDPGYTAQMMTALLALEYDPNLNKTVTLSPDLLDNWGFPLDFRSHLDYGFQKNATIPIKDMLAVMILENATSAATLLAATIGGSVENFVDMMNARAQELGMEKTVFANPTGVASVSATSTLQDLFKLTTLLYQDSRYMEIASKRSYTLLNNNFTVYTRNYLIGNWYTTDFRYSKATGMKTDSSFEKSNPLHTTTVIATATESDDNDYLVMVMGGQGSAAYGIATDFFHWGSTDFRSLKVIAREKLYKHLPVDGGDRTSQVPIFPEKDMTAFLPSSITLEDVTYKYSLTKKELSAPLKYGTKVGEVQAFVGEKMVASCNLIVGQNLAQGKDSQVYGVFGSILLSPPVLIGLFILTLYLLRKYLIYRKKKKG